MNKGYPRLYKEVYGNDPVRREGRKGVDGSLITLDEYEEMLKLGLDLKGYEEVYPLEEISESYNQNRIKIGYIEVDAFYRSQLIGVIQGWSCEDAGMKEKLSLGTINDLKLALGESSSTRQYLAEVFIDRNHQGQGILSGLLDRYYDIARSHDYTSILTRTVKSKPLPMLKFEKDGLLNIGGYPDTDMRNRALFLKNTL